MGNQYIEFIQDVLISVHENLHELEQRKNFADPDELDHIDAKIMAYREMIEIISVSAETFDLPKKEIGL
ncbi:MAG: hypothetical protein ABIR06_21285 [Cyclobacteriaceae bacterium]